MASSAFTDFGQKVDLTASIRNILRNYPEGTAVLKELVQNADDAGARVISFCLDMRQHNSESVVDNETMAQFQGPALLAYNDAVFTEEDFKSIQRIGDSLKKTAEDQAKIGRFGIGFNAVYHWTDLPSFVSSNYLVMLDPQARFLPNVNPSNPGKMVDWVKSRDVLTTFKDQFLPYQMPAYNMDFSSPFHGTLFRLPLRTPDQAATSTLSKRALSTQEAEALLDNLRAEASAMLLFLKNIETIEIKVFREDAIEAELKFHCSISNISSELRVQRAIVGDAPKLINTPGPNGAKNLSLEIASDYSLLIDCLALDSSSKAPENYVEHWEVCNQLGGANANAIATNPANVLLRLVPWGGLAACVTPHKSTALLGGLAYCFLPLPVQTGLPVMVNGFFELSSNRRDVWQAGVDMTGDGKTRAEWNISLMRDVIGPSYVRLLHRMRDLLGFSERYQTLWPSHKVGAPWDQVVNATLKGSKDMRLVRIHGYASDSAAARDDDSSGETASLVGLAGGAANLVLQPAKMLLGGLGSMMTKKLKSDSGYIDAADASWIECCRAILLPAASTHGLDADGESQRLVDFLVSASQPVVVCSQALQQTLESSKTVTLIATPSLVRAVVRDIALPRLGRSNESPNLASIKFHMCTFLLRYCLSDLQPDGDISELHQLAILPLQSDTIGSVVLFSASQAQAIGDVCSMGFSVSQATYALTHSKFNVMQAAELLTSSSIVKAISGTILIIPGEEEQRVFAAASSMMLAREKIGPKEREFLAHVCMQKCSNIRPFHASLVPDLLRAILPSECTAGTAVMMEKIAFPRGKGEFCTFIKEFWSFAAVRSDVVSAVAQGAAIVPSLGFQSLYPLSRMSSLICQVKGDVKLPSAIMDILARLGINIVDPVVLPDNAAMPKVYWDYVNNPSRSGVLAAIDTLVRGNKNVFASLNNDDRSELRLYISSAEPIKNLTPMELQVIRGFPIFSCYGDNSQSPIDISNSSRFSALLDPKRLSEELFPAHFLRHRSPQDLELLRVLGVTILSRGDYYRTQLLVNIKACYASHREATESSILEMLMELKYLVEEDKRIVQTLQNTAFLSAGGGSLHIPSGLFDPQEAELKVLLNETFFPSLIFQREDILVFLRSVGLQQSLNWAGVIACAKSIEAMDESNEASSEKKIKQGGCLVRFLDKNISQLLGEDKKKSESGGAFSLISTFRSLFGEKPDDKVLPIEQYVAQLVAIAWMPTPKISTHPSMPWPDSDGLSCTSCPNETRPLTDAWHCSSTRRIVSQPVSNPSLHRIFGWTQPINFKTIAIQLHKLAELFLLLRKEVLDAGQDRVNGLQDARETITGLIPQLYQRLNSVSDNEQDSSELVTILSGHAWIWVGETFVDPERVALVASVNAAPYLFQLPQDLRVYSRLLNVFKVKSSFTSRDYIQVLRCMAVDSGVGKGSSSDGDLGNPLSDVNIDIACSLITLLSTDGSVSATAQKELVYIPDNGGRLALSTALVNDDVPWMSGPEYVSIRVGCRLIHPNISSHVAEKMGVKSLRLTLVSKSIDSNLFSSGEKASLESFGQAESLTSRLRTILDMYPDGNPIFSELLQNADDAGASIVRFMLDENSYGIESLLDSKMAALQGPSLIVSNDAMFTEADYRSLARIGHGSKLEKLATTGRFGLGFNSTYHLTDTPTFVSGDHMVIFDPHCAYAPGATVNQPGLRIKYTGSPLRSTFKQQFEPFEFFGCNFQTQYHGTLFRFPLRSAAMARKSEISSRSYSAADVQANLQQLTGQLAHHILFLRSVRSIEIYHCLAGSTTPVLLHKAVSTVTPLETQNPQNLFRFFDKKAASAGAVQLSRDQFYTELQATPDCKLPLFTSRVKVAMQSFLLSDAAGTEQMNEELVEPSTEDVDYLIVTGLRGGDAKLMACDPKMRHLKLIPMGGVAACLSLRRQCASSTESISFPAISGQAFCFLPLPVQTRLPVHLNAYWELSSNRRDIWKGEDTQGEAKLRSDWNGYIMKDVLAPLYASLLTRVSLLPESLIISGISYPTLRLLPCPVPADHWSDISKSLFPLLANEKLLWSNLNGGMYVALRDAWLLDCTSTDGKGSDQDENTRSRLESLLLRENLAVSCVPSGTLQPLLASSCVAGEITPELVRRHFSNPRLPHLAMANFDDALFLLQFAFRDINKSNFLSLVGLPLLPLENGKLGVFQVSTAPALYTVSEAERKLLTSAGGLIVASDAILGHVVAACIKDPLFSAELNVKPLTPADIVELLKQFIPLNWFSDSTRLVDRCTVPALSQEWLAALWTYILEGHNLALFDNTFPMLPVLQPRGLRAGSYLAKISSSVPILHMTYKDMSPLAAGALSDLGIHIFDPSVLGGLAYSQDIGKLLQAPSPRGVMNALISMSDSIKRFTKLTHSSATSGVSKIQAPWPADVCDALREFILDEVIGKIEALTPEDCQVLCSMPIWPRHNCTSADKLATKYCEITLSENASSLKLPPRNVDSALLSSEYIMLRGERDRPLYRLLGLQELSKGVFYATYLIPNIEAGIVPDELVDGLVIGLLKDLQALESDYPGLADLFGRSKLIRSSRSPLMATGTPAPLKAPMSLYDPHVPGLEELLPSEVFPSAAFTDPSLLMSLRGLGLNGTMTCDGILQAARSIQLDYDAAQKLVAAEIEAELAKSDVAPPADAEGAIAKPPKEPKESSRVIGNIIRRATGLIRYMEVNIEKLLQESDPEGFEAVSNMDTGATCGDNNEQGRASSDLLVFETPTQRLRASPSGTALLGGMWSKELRAITWIPAFTSLPLRSVSGLPWPSKVHRGLLAAPSQCCHISDIWMCSSTTRISSAEINSALLRQLLGWSKPVCGRNAALQLLNLADNYENASADTKLKVTETCQSAFPKLLQCLQGAMERETQLEKEYWQRALRERPVVWISGRFIEANRVAFRALSSVNTEPYLFVVPQELGAYHPILGTLGVKDIFGAKDLVGMMRELHALHNGAPLSQNKVEMCAGILKLLVRLLIGGPNDSRPNVDQGDSSMQGKPTAESIALMPVPPTKPPRSPQKIQAETTSSIPLIPPQTLPKPIAPLVAPLVSFSDLGKVFMPDRAGILAESTSLSYDDAPWISALLLQKGSTIRFVHSSLALDDSLSLGVKSLREQLFAGDEVVCPDARKLHTLVQNDSLSETLIDLLSFSESLRAHSLHVLYDPRCHSMESLMHPGLAAAQGPAIVVHIDGPILSSEEVAQALSDIVVSKISAERGFVSTPGKKLMSAFAVTDCLQIVSGREFFIFDPTGAHLISDTAAEAQPKGGKPDTKRRAQRCFLSPSRETPSKGDSTVEGVLSRFPDQFEPFLSLPFGLQKALAERTGMGGMIIRMPLRTAASAISSNVCTEDAIRQAFVGYKPLLEGSLVLSQSLLNCSLLHFDLAAAEFQTLIALFLLTSPGKRSARLELLGDNGWKKNTLSSMFATYVPSESCYSVTVSAKCTTSGWLFDAASRSGGTDPTTDSITQITNNWLILSTMGAGRIKDEALKDSYKSFGLKPYCTIAAKILTNDELSQIGTAPDCGLFYSNGAPLGVSGLPFHVEGCFLSDPVDRHVPLTELITLDRARTFSILHPSREAPMHSGSILLWNLRLLQTIMEVLVPRLLQELTQGEASLGPGGLKRTAVTGVYKYWPYLSRMTEQTAAVATRCRMLHSLAAMPLFLTRSGFTPLDKTILPAWKWSSNLVAYLQTMLPVALCPQQVSVDFSAVQQKFALLTPSKLRDCMKGDSVTQCTRLRARYELVLPLLTYCLEDMGKHATEGEFVRRKAYRELAGTPLLPMADTSIRPFPKSAREQVCVAPPCAHALLPQLKSSFIHPTLLNTPSFSLLEDPLVRDTLYISAFSASFLKNNMASVMPAEWQRCQAVRWIVGNSSSSTAGRGIHDGDVGLPPPLSELLMFVLWRDMLSKESNLSELEGLAGWPLVPVVSRGRRLLLSSALLPHLFSLVPSAAQDTERTHLAREAGRLSNLVLSEAARATARMATAESTADSWDWVSIRPNAACRSLPNATPVPSEPSISISERPNVVIEAVAVEVQPSFDEEIVDSHGVPQAMNVATVESNVNVEVHFTSTPADEEDGALDEWTDPNSSGLSAAPAALHHAASRLGLPVLDGAMFEGPPRALSSTGHWGRRILNSLSALSQANVLVASGSTHSDEPLLCFDEYSVADRTELLLEIYETHKAAPFSPTEVEKLKSLRLFTSTAEGGGKSAIAVAECKGVYWCANSSVLDGLSLIGEVSSAGPPYETDGNTTTATSQRGALDIGSVAPVILWHDPLLLPVYHLVGVEELTAAIAVRKFTLPSLHRMDGERRMEIFEKLSHRWVDYKEDNELVAQLKTVAFIPYWAENDINASPAAAHALLPSSAGLYRRPNELLSWTNAALLEALQGSAQPQYFASPSFRNPRMAAMCMDLGMAPELTKESFLRIAKDIQASAAATASSKGTTDDQEAVDAQKSLLDRGRRILRYVKDSDESVTLLDKDLAKKLSNVAFVPLNVPVSVESGGYVTYRAEVGRFGQALSKAGGALAFTVMPILDDDISPHQIFFSSLAITTSPPLDTVMEHIRLLTQNGESHSVDRWNSELFTVRSAFSQLFTYLSDCWKDIPAHTKKFLRAAALIPVGHLLIKPCRLFFRLPEDLSPFMHEIPRYLGTHEGFLKVLGVKETPSGSDYCSFLSDLADETRGNALNPNELRATVAIVQSIAADTNSSSSSSSSSSRDLQTPSNVGLFVPDEDSVLRSTSQCLVNDDPWVRGRAGDDIRLRMGLHILHPSLAGAAPSLKIPPISAVLVEKLQGGELAPVPEEQDMIRHFGPVLGSSAVLGAVSALTTKANSSTTALLYSGQESIAQALSKIKMHFVAALPTHLAIRDPRQPRAAPVDLIGGSGNNGSSGQINSLSFVDHDENTGGAQLYVNVSLVLLPMTLEIAVALGVCRMLGLDTSLAATLACLLTVPHSLAYPSLPAPTLLTVANEHDTQRVLNLLRVGSDHVTVRERHRGIAGEKLTSGDFCLLELKPFRVFRLGEIVAYNISDENTGVAGDARVEDDVSVPVVLDLRYAIVVSTGDDSAASNGVRRLVLRGLHDRTVSILCTSVYSFKSGRDAGAGEKTGQGPSSTPLKAVAGEATSSNPRSQIDLSPKAVSQPQPPAQVVSQEEVLGAMRGLLKRAGIPMSLEQQSMLSRLVELEAAQRRLESDLLSERTNLHEAKAALAAASSACKCQVCFNNDVGLAMVPCGHTICEVCIGHLHGNQCPFCRSKISTRVKIFLREGGIQ